MKWENVADIALWAKENLDLPDDIAIVEVKIKNLGEGFEVTVAFQRISQIHTPVMVHRVRVDSYGHIVKSDKLNVINNGLKWQTV